VRAVFSAKCARCHGPDLPRPRAGFGHVLDLRRLAAEPDKVVPSKPGESGLWQQVQSGEMPPPDSPAGPLTSQEKAVIRAWIEAGAPAERSAQVGDKAKDPPSLPVVRRTLLWLGKFHLPVVHFPIALLVAAMVAELWSAWKGRRGPSPQVRFCLGLAAAFAIPAVALGWLFASGGRDTSGLLALHRWIGTGAGAWAVALAIRSELDVRRGVRSWSTRALLLVGVLMVGVAAHLGGLMAHGQGFFDW
jgi:hypothetical protein